MPSALGSQFLSTMTASSFRNFRPRPHENHKDANVPLIPKAASEVAVGTLDRGAREIDAGPMRLMLLRHAKAEKAEAGMRDHERRLNARGQHDAPLIGAYMARHALLPDRVMVSTAERTRETWQRLSAALEARPQVNFEERLYNAGSDAILTLAKHIQPPVRTLLV